MSTVRTDHGLLRLEVSYDRNRKIITNVNRQEYEPVHRSTSTVAHHIVSAACRHNPFSDSTQQALDWISLRGCYVAQPKVIECHATSLNAPGQYFRGYSSGWFSQHPINRRATDAEALSYLDLPPWRYRRVRPVGSSNWKLSLGRLRFSKELVTATAEGRVSARL